MPRERVPFSLGHVSSEDISDRERVGARGSTIMPLSEAHLEPPSYELNIISPWKKVGRSGKNDIDKTFGIALTELLRDIL